MRAGGSAAATAGDALARDITVFSQVLDGLRNGNDELGITAVRGAAAIAALEQSQQKWEAMKQDADAILASSRQLFAAHCSKRSPRSARCPIPACSRISGSAWCPARCR
ncbi:hypothetical protein G6F50_017699 [Rhizopus delemar]|uniref:NarX-like N-terminal domain-containing protein n=1 Tax=Rhizopus delemar TaxID=936053 RepID=A0A9P6XPE9_9FUNG|nr:hypothetical protein G6F50_017699 [Rhizopus delemar]